MIAWKKVTISDVADEVTVGHVGPMASEYVDKGIPFLRSLNIEPFNIKYDGVKFITASFHKRLQKSSLRPGDVVIVRTGKPGTCAVIPDWLLEANCSDVVIVRCSERVRPRFLCYVVNSVAGHHISSHIVGAVQQHFNVGSARTLEFLLPSIEGQDAILAILGALDDKIDLNRRTNETLEAMARAVFRDWFVDFGPTRAKMAGQTPYLAPELWELFPDRLDDEGKPEGWRIASIDSLCRITSGKRPPNKETSPSDENPVPVYGGNGISWFTKDVLFNQPFLITGRVGTLGTVFRINEKCWVSDNALCLFPKIDSYFEYLYFIVSGIDFQSLNSGSTQPLLTQSSLLSQECILPAEEIITIFHTQISVWFEMQQQLEKESHTLAQLRDLLLPKLMSGEISIRDAEKMVEDAA